MIPDESRNIIKIDEVLALYLIDVADLCQQIKPPNLQKDIKL